MTRLAFERLGCRIEFDGNDVIVPPGQQLRVQVRRGRGRSRRSRTARGPPSRPTSPASRWRMATQADGMVLIHEKMFENRLFFVDKLVSMGARVIVCDPHRAVVSGPSRLHGERMESPDIRAGMAMLIAALCAEGTSEIGNIRQIDRGYERIDERLRGLGARIERVATERVRGRSTDVGGRMTATRSRRAPATCCPTRCASCARSPARCAPTFERRRLRRGAHARARVRGRAAPRRRARGRRALPHVRRARATCSRCAPT